MNEEINMKPKANIDNVALSSCICVSVYATNKCNEINPVTEKRIIKEFLEKFLKTSIINVIALEIIVPGAWLSPVNR